jgi:hypothetical protein
VAMMEMVPVQLNQEIALGPLLRAPLLSSTNPLLHVKIFLKILDWNTQDKTKTEILTSRSQFFLCGLKSDFKSDGHLIGC